MKLIMIETTPAVDDNNDARFACHDKIDDNK